MVMKSENVQNSKAAKDLSKAIHKKMALFETEETRGTNLNNKNNYLCVQPLQVVHFSRTNLI